MKLFYTTAHHAHDPLFEFEGGRFIAAHERASRAEIIKAALLARKLGNLALPRHFGNEPILRVHTPEFVAFMGAAFARWQERHGKDAPPAFPSVWPGRTLSPAIVADGEAILGNYTFDMGTPILAGTFNAARAACDVALSAAQDVLAGAKLSFALTRPPGHHAASDLYGGYCFFNNAALAAQLLSDTRRRVAILDVDMHHGNGTQAIFYERPDVLTVSIHGDPAHIYPYFLGRADEKGRGAGEGANLNLPLAPRSGWSEYSAALASALARIREFGADTLVLPLGVDTVAGDPTGAFRLEGSDFTRMGWMIASLELPTVITMEGGYRLDVLGNCVADVVDGLRQKLG